jgi:hypothetical protein
MTTEAPFAPAPNYNPMVLNKPSRANTQKLDAMALKPAQHSPGPNGTELLFAVYVSRNGKEIRHRCTKEVFAKIRGRHHQNREHSGLDLKLDTGFILHADPTSGLITSIDQYPTKSYRHGFLPEDTDKRKNVVLIVNEDGSVTVTEKPDKMRETKLVRLIRALDDLAQVERGMVIDKQFQVEDIMGSRLTISFTGEDEAEFEVAGTGTPDTW